MVGDVHGCRKELTALLERVGFRTGDRLVLVGDLVARGPDSVGVLDVVRRTGALTVLGNHEAKIVAHRAHGGPLGDEHRAVARALRPVDWVLLENAPRVIDLPEHELRVVHAGLVPGRAIERQDPEMLVRMRTIDGRGAPHTTRDRGALWGTRYVGPPHVVFGHNAVDGLQLHPWATGLDTGCVYGNALTALVLEAGQKVPRARAARRAALVSVPARRTYWKPAW